jgi:peroxiredoxin
MNKTKTISFLLLGVGLILIGAGFSIRLLKQDQEPPAQERAVSRNCVQPAPVSFQAPNLELETLNRHTIKLDDYLGKTVLLNAWATWCPPCLAELPDLEAYFQAHRDEDFVLIGVNIGEAQQVVQNFIERNPLSFPIWLDPGEKTLRELNTISLPYSIVIDGEGEVKYAWSGATCLDHLESTITPMLRQ